MGRLILKDCNLLDGLHPTVAGRTVVIDGDRIAAVTAGDVDPGATGGDAVVDLGGRTVMPGMTTCHFHSTYQDLGSTPAPYGSEHPPAFLALLSHSNLMKALRCGYTMRSAPVPARTWSRESRRRSRADSSSDLGTSHVAGS